MVWRLLWLGGSRMQRVVAGCLSGSLQWQKETAISADGLNNSPLDPLEFAEGDSAASASRETGHEAAGLGLDATELATSTAESSRDMPLSGPGAGEAVRRSTVTRRRSSRHRGPTPAARTALWVIAGVALVLALAVVVDVSASAGRIHPGVTVAGLKVGGQTPAAATTFLQSELTKKAASPITVTYSAEGKTKSWPVTSAQVDLSYDTMQIANEAMKVGRSGGFFGSVGARAGAWFKGASVPASATSDPKKLKAVTDKIISGVAVAPIDAALKVTGTTVTSSPAQDGVGIERTVLQDGMLGAFSSGNRTVVLRTVVAKPRISDAAAQSAKLVAQKMIAGPATVTHVKDTWTLSGTELGRAMKFQAVEATGAARTSSGWSLDPVFAPAQLSKVLAPKLGAALGNPPQDARFATNKGSVSIVPSRDGVGPDVDALAKTLATTLKNGSLPRTAALLTRITPPKFTTEEARAMGVHERISTFTTEYSGGAENAARINNIHTLGAALDGKLIAPGATFSFNGAVGQRTAAKGYQEANAIVKGKLVPQLGGGICQVGTTLFNTVFFSGMPVLERENHSFYISHYPTGRDATVSWGGPDLRWKNDTKNWMLLAVSYTDTSITISLYGTSPGYDVTYTTGPFTDPKPYPTETVVDSTLQPGVKVVTDGGLDGRKCVVTRVVKSGSTVVRTDTFASNYKPKTEVVRVGPAVKGSKTASSTPTPKKP